MVRQPGAHRDRRPGRAASSALPGAGPLRLLVVGGSLGAAALNETVPQGAGADCRQRSGRRWCTSPAPNIWKRCRPTMPPLA